MRETDPRKFRLRHHHQVKNSSTDRQVVVSLEMEMGKACRDAIQTAIESRAKGGRVRRGSRYGISVWLMAALRLFCFRPRNCFANCFVRLFSCDSTSSS